jgi:hypothetical protein
LAVGDRVSGVDMDGVGIPDFEMDEKRLLDADIEGLKVNRAVTDGVTEVESDTLNEALGLDVAESEKDSAGVDDSFRDKEGDKEEVLVGTAVTVESNESVLARVIVKNAVLVEV